MRFKEGSDKPIKKCSKCFHSDSFCNSQGSMCYCGKHSSDFYDDWHRNIPTWCKLPTTPNFCQFSDARDIIISYRKHLQEDKLGPKSNFLSFFDKDACKLKLIKGQEVMLKLIFGRVLYGYISVVPLKLHKDKVLDNKTGDWHFIDDFDMMNWGVKKRK